MVKNIKYLLFAIVILVISSCDKEPSSLTPPSYEWPEFNGYMQFSTGVASKADLATSLRGRSFGVIGYRYASNTNWATAKPLAKPFRADDDHILEVETSEKGVCTYDISEEDGLQLIPWEEYLYSFFAFHPCDGKGISLSGSNVVNTPKLTYTYEWLDDIGNTISAYENEDIFDLMTAEAIDINGEGTGTVNMEFKHRMFALEVLATNYNESANGVDASQTITNLTLTLDGLKHTGMVIPLSMQTGEADPDYIEGTVNKPVFQISNTQVKIPAFNEEGGGGVATSISKEGSDKGGYLMFIPQGEGKLTGTFNWNELVGFEGNVQKSFVSTLEFEAGKLYQVIINFVGTGITIAIIEAGSWDIKDVYHTFE